MAFYAADRAGAGATRCQQHRLDARERAALVTGDGARVLVIGDSWSVGLGQDDLGLSWAGRLPGEVHVAGFSGSGLQRPRERVRPRLVPRPRAHRAGDPARAGRRRGRPQRLRPAGAAAIDRGFRDLMADLAGQHVVVVGPADAPSRSRAVPRVDGPPGGRSRRSTASPTSAPATSTSPTSTTGLHLTAAGHREFGDAVAERIAAAHAGAPGRSRALIRRHGNGFARLSDYRTVAPIVDRTVQVLALHEPAVLRPLTAPSADCEFVHWSASPNPSSSPSGPNP